MAKQELETLPLDLRKKIVIFELMKRTQKINLLIFAVIAVFAIMQGEINAQSWSDDAVEVKIFSVDKNGAEEECTMFETGMNVRVYYWQKNIDHCKKQIINYEVKNLDAGTSEMYETSIEAKVNLQQDMFHKGKWQIIIYDPKSNKELGMSPVFVVKR